MSLFSRQPLAAAIRASMLGGFAIIASPSYAGFTEVTETIRSMLLPLAQ